MLPAAPDSLADRTRRRARAAESARLEIVCGATHRGFKSHRLRHASQPPQLSRGRSHRAHSPSELSGHYCLLGLGPHLVGVLWEQPTCGDQLVEPALEARDVVGVVAVEALQGRRRQGLLDADDA